MNKKLLALAGTVATAGVALAEGENAGDALAGSLGTAFGNYITSASTALGTLLTGGIVIVGAFFIWRVLKKGFNAAK